MKLILFTILMIVCSGSVVNAQFGNSNSSQVESRARQELAKLGVDEKELRTRLLSEGIDLDKLTPQQIIAARPQIEAVVAKMKAEEKVEIDLSEAESEVFSDAKKDVNALKDAVENGSTVDEAQSDIKLDRNAASSNKDSSLIYGHEIFRNNTLDVFRASDQAKAPGSYILDTGDELAISIFGSSQADLLLEINDDGFIRPAGIPKIYLRGRRLEEARKLVESRMSLYYAFEKGQFSLSLDVARTVTISVYGEVERSGSYTLSALNSPLNALVAAGGPLETGSVRRIELIREGKKSIIDVYGFLLGTTNNNPLALDLRNNDIIRIPLAKKIITISGGVQRPMMYELTPEDNITAVIEYAGGTIPRANLEASRIERYENGTLKVLDVSSVNVQRASLKNGDRIEIPIVEFPIEDFVTIEGDVQVSGRFEFRQNQPLSTLLTKAVLNPTARKDVAFIERFNNDGTRKLIRLSIEEGNQGLSEKLQRGDKVRILSNLRFSDQTSVTIRGAIRDSSRIIPFPEDGSFMLDEAILLAGGLESNAVKQAIVIRTPTENSTITQYEKVQIEQASSFQLKPNDEIVIYTQERFEETAMVSIDGAVKSPGQFRFDKSLGINDLLYLAGGTTFNAASDRVEIYRLDLTNNETRTLVEKIDLNPNGLIDGTFELKPHDEVYVRSSANFEEIQHVYISGEVTFPGTYARLPGKNRVSDFIERAGGLTNDAFSSGATLYRGKNGIGYIVLGLDKIIKDKYAPQNIILNDNDTIFIPKPQELISIDIQGTNATRLGRDSLNADGTIQVAFQGERKADWYVEEFAGGFSSRAKRKRTVVKTASGQIRETKSTLGFKSYPKIQSGSTIVVGLKPAKREKLPRAKSSWSDVASITFAGITALVTSIVLITRI